MNLKQALDHAASSNDPAFAPLLAEIERLEDDKTEILSTLRYVVENIADGFINEAVNAANDSIGDYE